MAISPDKLAHFESIGPSGVLLEIARLKHGWAPDSPLWREALGWVESQKLLADLAASDRRDAREEETLSISRKANRIAERALFISKMANIWAAIAVLIATIAIASDVLISNSQP